MLELKLEMLGFDWLLPISVSAIWILTALHSSLCFFPPTRETVAREHIRSILLRDSLHTSGCRYGRTRDASVPKKRRSRIVQNSAAATRNEVRMTATRRINLLVVPNSFSTFRIGKTESAPTPNWPSFDLLCCVQEFCRLHRL